MGKELTLSELAAQSKGNTEKVNVIQTGDSLKSAVPVYIGDLAKNLPGKEEEEIKDPIVVQNAFEAMANRLNESKKFIEEEVMPVVIDNAREIAMENELKEQEALNKDINTEVEEEEVSYEAPIDINLEIETEEPQPKKSESKEDIEIENITTPKEELDSDITDIDNFLAEFDDEDKSDFSINELDTEETAEETRARFKESLNDIKVSKDELDLSTFTISNKPVSSSAVLNSINKDKTSKESDWVLYGSKRSIRMNECSGPELDALRKSIDNSNTMNGVIASLKLAYNHIVDANKPSFETWCKTTKTEDLEDIYFALYKACYGDVNLVGRSCPDPKENKDNDGCGKTSIINMPIMDMIKYENDEVKTDWEKIFQQDTTTPEKVEIKSHLIMASDDIAISYSEPTLYTTFIQFASLPANVTNRYVDMLNSLAYINGFYLINKETKVLSPINIKVYPTNLNKTILSKLKVYSNILKTLTNDQYSILTTKLNNLIKDPKVTYVYPETECPECGSKIPEEEVDSMLSLLFTRAQLAQIKSL